jgi:hypothetical protein
LLEKRNTLLNNFASFAATNPKKTLLFFYQADFTHPKFNSLFKDKNILLQNTIINPIYSKKDNGAFIKYLQLK